MLRKLLLFITIAILYSPFGPDVQAETNNTENKTVSEMFLDSNGENADKKTDSNVKKSEGKEAQEKVENPIVLDDEPPQLDSQLSWFDFVKMFFALAVVIALIYIVLRFVNNKNRLYGQTKTMENLGGIPLGTNRSIQLIRMGDSVLVIGVGETIQLLKEITSPEEIEQLTNSQNQVQPLQVGQSIFKKMLPKSDDQNSRSSSVGSFSSMLKGQLDELTEGRKKVYDQYKRDQDE